MVGLFEEGDDDDDADDDEQEEEGDKTCLVSYVLCVFAG